MSEEERFKRDIELINEYIDSRSQEQLDEDLTEILENFANGEIEKDKLELFKGGYKMGFLYTNDLQKSIDKLLKENNRLLVISQLKDKVIDEMAKSILKDRYRESIENEEYLQNIKTFYFNYARNKKIREKWKKKWMGENNV